MGEIYPLAIIQGGISILILPISQQFSVRIEARDGAASTTASTRNSYHVPEGALAELS